MTAGTALDQDPDFRFNATPPPGMIAAVMLLSIAAHLLSRAVWIIAVAVLG